jgi:hypothetical protein
MPGFPRALARTLEELALAGVTASALGPLTDVGRDLANLVERFEEQFQSVSSVDRSVFLRTATRAVEEGGSAFLRCRLVLLDVALANEAEGALVAALVSRAPEGSRRYRTGTRRRSSTSLKSQVSSVTSSGSLQT